LICSKHVLNVSPFKLAVLLRHFFQQLMMADLLISIFFPFWQVSLSDFLTLFSARTQEDFFWNNQPGKPLVFAALMSLTLSTILACTWPESTMDGIPVMGLARGDYKLIPLWVWMYCLLFWFIQDSLKVSCLLLIQQFCWFEQKQPSLSSHFKYTKEFSDCFDRQHPSQADKAKV
jgi:hypothetical protein